MFVLLFLPLGSAIGSRFDRVRAACFDDEAESEFGDSRYQRRLCEGQTKDMER